MSRIDDLEERIAALEYEVGTYRSGRPGFRASATRPARTGESVHLIDYHGPYGYGSQDR